jgi:hypothetical protein
MERGMRRTRWTLWLGLVAACGPAESALPPVAAAPARPEPFFEREGVPGPWWRDGATPEMFESEHRACLRASGEARRGAEDPADAAYRAFLACMETARWQRGLPPSRPRRATLPAARDPGEP